MATQLKTASGRSANPSPSLFVTAARSFRVPTPVAGSEVLVVVSALARSRGPFPTLDHRPPGERTDCPFARR